jgi:TorA maturation chaperone TorD
MIDEPNPRAHLYALLARLLLDELDQPLARYLRGLPGLAEHIPPEAQLAAWLADLRVEHHRLFMLNVYPYESIFRDHELMLNTAVTQRVAALYAACGRAPAARVRAAAPDHLGVELALMGELAACAPHTPADQAWMVELLHQHLAAWLPACAEALAHGARAPLYRALAGIAVELMLADLDTSSASPHLQHDSRRESGAFDLPVSPLSLQAGGEGPDLRQIVRRLLTPDAVGVFISRTDIIAIGHALGLPAPIADREQMLFGLFGAAGQFDQAPALLGALADRLRTADATYARHTAEHAAWAAYGQAWRGRVAAGLTMLAEMGREHQMMQGETE